MKTKITKITDMILIQDDLNEVLKPNWKNRVTLGDYNMAIISEFSELVGSGRQWKWWKTAGIVNEWNEKIEVIDILHFGLSKLSLMQYQKSATPETLGIDYSDSTIRTLPHLINNDGSFNNTDASKILVLLLRDSANNIIDALHALFNAYNMTNYEISIIYSIKVSLNYYRQNSGYNDGTYSKIINGREDNEFLYDLYVKIKDSGNFVTLDYARKQVFELFGT